MLNFCTLFNSAYLSRGLAMYYSLLEQCDDFHLYIFAFDKDCLETLRTLNLGSVTIVSLEEFENEELLAVKRDRTPGEYCWTCTSSTIWYCIHHYSLDHCTYIDADLLFFGDPKVLIDEMGDLSVLITEHRYTPQYDQSSSSGIYCVQFVTFKNDEQGLKVLSWWRDACLEWCYNRFEEGKFGDQKYLDDWTERFSAVHELRHLGGGVAPWNTQQYHFKNNEKEVILHEITTGKEAKVIFFHFHAFRYSQGNVFHLTADEYILSENVIKLLYKPYAEALVRAENIIRATNSNVVYHEPLFELSWLERVRGRKLMFILKGYYKNYFKRKKLLKIRF